MCGNLDHCLSRNAAPPMADSCGGRFYNPWDGDAFRIEKPFDPILPLVCVFPHREGVACEPSENSAIASSKHKAMRLSLVL